jgi:hypothetical protein
MTKATRRDLDHVVAIAPSRPEFAAATLAVLHRCATTDRDARLMERLAQELGLSVSYHNGCMIAD